MAPVKTDAEQADEALLQDIAERERKSLKELERISESEKRAFRVVVHYLQVVGTISSTPAASFWTTHWMFAWLRWLTFNLFTFSALQMNKVMRMQVELVCMLTPCLLGYYLSERLWSDTKCWRQHYIEDWPQTRNLLSPLQFYVPTLPSSLLSLVVFCFGLLLVNSITVGRAAVMLLLGFSLQWLYGALMLVIANVARVRCPLPLPPGNPFPNGALFDLQHRIPC